ncbi:unnamed protein product [Amaranthus hypochondriacus]
MVEGVKEPTSYDEAARSKVWRKAMEEEIQALHQNQTWELVLTPKQIQALHQNQTKPDEPLKGTRHDW